MLPVPPHFERDRVGEIWRVPYEERAVEAAAWKREHRLGAAADDRFRLALVLVDVQNTFCRPGSSSSSPRARRRRQRRLCEFVYRNLGAITQVVPTLDTHQAMQIFHALWLVDEQGRASAAVHADHRRGRRTRRLAIRPGSRTRDRHRSGAGERHLVEYVRRLEQGGKYSLTIWPYHAMRGGIGNALVSSVEEAVFFHTVARRSQPAFEVKGSIPWTEHYSVIGPEVTEGPDGQVAPRNEALVEGCSASTPS